MAWTYKRRGDMTPEERERARAREKETSYLRRTGRPVTVDPAPAIAHIRDLHARGMTYEQMAEQSALGKTTLQDLGRGRRDNYRGGNELKRLDRRVVEVALMIEFEEYNKRGSATDSTGVRRRLQGLMALGFPGTFIASEIGATAQWVWRLVNFHPTSRQETVEAVSAIYEKYQFASPEDFGIRLCSINRTKNHARKNGFATPGCWDEDTIDDPNAIPEWTGACGTPLGARIHKRDDIPMCHSCRGALEGDPMSEFSGEKVMALRESRGLSRKQLADQLGMHDATIFYWETGRSKPQTRDKLDLLLSALDATVEDVMGSED